MVPEVTYQHVAELKSQLRLATETTEQLKHRITAIEAYMQHCPENAACACPECVNSRIMDLARMRRTVRVIEIKARLYDLLNHSCNGCVSVPPQEGDHGCTLCAEVLHLKAELEEIMDYLHATL